jgi:hypothetical protein
MSSGANGDAGVIDHKSRPVVHELGLEPECARGVVIALATGIIRLSGVLRLEPLEAEVQRVNMGRWRAGLLTHPEPSR